MRAKWLDDGRFWYRDSSVGGWDFVLVDPATKAKTPAFDQAKLANALKAASNGQIKSDSRHLAITDLVLSKPRHRVTRQLSARANSAAILAARVPVLR